MRGILFRTAAAVLTIMTAFGGPATTDAAPMSASTMRTFYAIRMQQLAIYRNQAGIIVAGNVRRIREGLEAEAARKAGRPVPLPTGQCAAVLTVQKSDAITRARLGSCTSAELGRVELRAIHDASPLPPPGIVANLTIITLIPSATPGFNGQ